MLLLQHALGCGLQFASGLRLWVLRCKDGALVFRGPVLSSSRAQGFLRLGLPDEGSYKAGEQWIFVCHSQGIDVPYGKSHLVNPLIPTCARQLISMSRTCSFLPSYNASYKVPRPPSLYSFVSNLNEALTL